MARISQASHTGSKGGVVIDGLDVVVRDLNRKALTIRPQAGAVCVAAAAQAAQRMRDKVPIGPPDLHVLDTITADSRPTFDGSVVYADAGPDPRMGPQAFVARFLEHGTVHMAPQPFVDPSADEQMPLFARAISQLGKL